jgi:hypothetical protein
MVNPATADRNIAAASHPLPGMLAVRILIIAECETIGGILQKIVATNLLT